jgi:hypothetical protein
MLSKTPKTERSRRRRAYQRERGGATFICPKCMSLSRVMRTARPNDPGDIVLRQRRCLECDLIFNTKEIEYAEEVEPEPKRKTANAKRK